MLGLKHPLPVPHRLNLQPGYRLFTLPQPEFSRGRCELRGRDVNGQFGRFRTEFNQPGWVRDELGERLDRRSDARRWDRAARTLARYRIEYEITGVRVWGAGRSLKTCGPSATRRS